MINLYSWIMLKSETYWGCSETSKMDHIISVYLLESKEFKFIEHWGWEVEALPDQSEFFNENAM